MSTYSELQNTLNANIEDVYKLAEFDHLILDSAIRQLQSLEAKLNKEHFIDNPALTARNTRISLENIRTNDSLRLRFETINNQCVVLLVSLFASSLGDLFRSAITYSARSGYGKSIIEEELKLTVGELLSSDFDISDRIGYLIQDKKDISFQDMKSIGRAFRDYFEIEVERDEVVNNLIMAQAARHVIVHDGARINERLLSRVKSAFPRKLLPSLPSNGFIKIQEQDLRLIGGDMLRYFERVRFAVEAVLSVA